MTTSAGNCRDPRLGSLQRGAAALEYLSVRNNETQQICNSISVFAACLLYLLFPAISGFLSWHLLCLMIRVDPFHSKQKERYDCMEQFHQHILTGEQLDLQAFARDFAAKELAPGRQGM